MKKVNVILLLAAFLAAGNAAYSGTVAYPYQVGNWPGFRSAAITYTFDDHCSNQFVIAVPLFNQYGYKLTLYPVPDWSPNWTNIENAGAAGHEVGSHTMSHPHLPQLTIEQQTTELVNSQNTVNSHIPSQQCVTLAYPFCEPSDQALTATYYIGARHCQGAIEANTPSNFYQISSIICGSQGQGVQTAADFNTKFASVAASKGWCVFLIHGIDGDGGYSPLQSTALRASVQYLDAHRSTFWVSTFGNVVRYIRERNSVSVTESSNTGNTITLQITDTLNDANYNYPVTIRRPLPAGWESAKVSQNGQPAAMSIIDVNSVKYFMFDAVPDGGNVVLIKAPAPPAHLTTAGFSTVALDWNDNNAVDLAGYNVYRSATSGNGYTKLNNSLLNNSDYTDDIGTIDTPYYYVATAVDVNSLESFYSNEISGGLYGDFTGNGIVEITDLPGFFSFWLLNNCDETNGVDLDLDCTVNFNEFAVLAENRLQAP
jgi:oligosaccharide reducing-end xylanase